METKLFFSTETCKLFLAGLVLDSLAMYSVGLYSIKVAIENVNIIDELYGSKIDRNRDFDCRLWPDCKLFLVALVSKCFGYVFSRPIFNKHFSRRQSKMLNYYLRCSY